MPYILVDSLQRFKFRSFLSLWRSITKIITFEKLARSTVLDDKDYTKAIKALGYYS